MRVDPLVTAAAATVAGFVVGAGAAAAAARRRREENSRRVGFKVAFPIPHRANLTVTFDADDDCGPFAARATIVDGADLALTRDSVDGLPDGDDRHELFAPMVEAPLGAGNQHRLVGMIGIQGSGAEIRGRVRIEIFNRWGHALAARIRDL